MLLRWTGTGSGHQLRCLGALEEPAQLDLGMTLACIGHVEAGQEVTNIRALMQQQCLLIAIVRHSHPEDSNGSAEVLDVKGGSKGSFELPGPLRVAAEYQQVIDIDSDVDNQLWGNKGVTRAVTFQLEQTIIGQKVV